MTTELQNKAWSVLPKEFKKEVKRMFQKDINTCNNMNQAMRCILVDIFGPHNLTSDADGEEILICDRNTVRMLYDRTDSVKVRQTLESLFGSKCLPDDTKDDTREPKPAGPKFKVGDKVRHKGDGKTYTIHMGNGFYLLEDENRTIKDGAVAEQHLEPYTEPKKESRNLSQETANCDKHFDNILKDSFSKERRLNIAAMAMQGILSNPQLLKIAIETYQEEIGSPDIYVAVAKAAKEQADALIAECELTEKLKEN